MATLAGRNPWRARLEEDAARAQVAREAAAARAVNDGDDDDAPRRPDAVALPAAPVAPPQAPPRHAAAAAAVPAVPMPVAAVPAAAVPGAAAVLPAAGEEGREPQALELSIAMRRNEIALLRLYGIAWDPSSPEAQADAFVLPDGSILPSPPMVAIAALHSRRSPAPIHPPAPMPPPAPAPHVVAPPRLPAVPARPAAAAVAAIAAAVPALPALPAHREFPGRWYGLGVFRHDLPQVGAADAFLPRALLGVHLPSFRFDRKPTAAVSEHDDRVRCILCFEDFVPGALLTTLPCLHYYHSPCVSSLLASSHASKCPLCKHPIA